MSHTPGVHPAVTRPVSQTVRLSVWRMSRPFFEGSYLQTTWWALGRWKESKNVSNDKVICPWRAGQWFSCFWSSCNFQSHPQIIFLRNSSYLFHRNMITATNEHEHCLQQNHCSVYSWVGRYLLGGIFRSGGVVATSAKDETLQQMITWLNCGGLPDRE